MRSPRSFLLAAVVLIAFIVAVARMMRIPQRDGNNENLGASSVMMKSSVPFVGCRSDGQGGPLEPITGTRKLVPIPNAATRKLAYYASEDGFGVLAPRDWHCFGTYGSSGDALYVSPRVVNPDALFSRNSKGFTGSVIFLSRHHGATSGRYVVARTIARVFPTHQAFVRDVIDEGNWPESEFALRPFPKDKLLYRNNEVVEYKTPPHEDGLGADGDLQPNEGPITGVVILSGADSDLIKLSIRLSSTQSSLAPLIIQQIETDMVNQQPTSIPMPSTAQSVPSPPKPQTSKPSMGYPASEELFVDAYVLANIGRDNLTETELERLGRAEYQMGRQIDTQTLLLGGEFLSTRGKRAIDYIDQHRK